MRKLKFRAWDSETKQFFYFSIDHKTAAPVWTVDPIVPRFEDGVEQYAGVEDKNGKEIFEGDIVRKTHFHSDHGKNVTEDTVAIWDDEHYGCGFVLKTNRGHMGIESALESEMGEDEEVIGNIHKTPELVPDWYREEQL